MNYDSTISKDVSLSRVLDEMILDGSDFDLIVQFLKSHESSIKDIYAHSVFSYDLYDLISHPFRMNEFVTEHIIDLPEPYRYYYLASHMLFGLDNMDSKFNYKYFKSLCERNPIDMGVQGNKYITKIRGHYKDRDFIQGEDDLVEYLNGVANKNDELDINLFMGKSYLAANVFTAKVFNQLNINAKFIILSRVKKHLEYLFPSNIEEEHILMGLVVILLKQLAYMNDIDEFNWVVNVLCVLRSPPSQALIGEIIRPNLPENIRELINADADFSEVVFDMNLVETQFDVLDLFLYIYIVNNNLRKQMIEAIDLVDFFNLGFDWRELELIKNGVNSMRC